MFQHETKALMLGEATGCTQDDCCERVAKIIMLCCLRSRVGKKALEFSECIPRHDLALASWKDSIHGGSATARFSGEIIHRGLCHPPSSQQVTSRVN